MRALEERELEDRLATLPDFFVAEVRLEAAAARFVVDFDAPRAFEADFTAPRLELREADFRAVERAEVERAEDFLAADLAEVFLAVVFLAAVLAVVFLAVDFLAADLADERVAVFLAAVFFAVVFLATAFLAVAFFAPDLAEDFVADREADFAAVFLAAVFVPAFLAVLVEPRRALLFLAVFLVLVAPVSPVNSIVSGFDLVSVGIAASFKGLRVQPSRLQGNVVIPTGFRLSESVDSRTLTFSVDMLPGMSLCTCRSKTQYRVQDETVRVSSLGASMSVFATPRCCDDV
ncbi:hypothetical protein [Microvirga tunisiensis]|uniref:hypothetical protein n=1 Tax=Microvirga tunisiensis TaxID=2108360 RepID=UPI00192E04E7|nr:hypothetical protein [Microvirga tunisiensis]